MSKKNRIKLEIQLIDELDPVMNTKGRKSGSPSAETIAVTSLPNFKKRKLKRFRGGVPETVIGWGQRIFSNSVFDEDHNFVLKP